MIHYNNFLLILGEAGFCMRKDLMLIFNKGPEENRTPNKKQKKLASQLEKGKLPPNKPADALGSLACIERWGRKTKGLSLRS